MSKARELIDEVKRSTNKFKKFVIVTKEDKVSVAELNTKKEVDNWFKQQKRYNREDVKILTGKDIENTTFLPQF